MSTYTTGFPQPRIASAPMRSPQAYLVLITLMLCVTSGSSAARPALDSAAASTCASAIPLTPGEVWRDAGRVERSACFTVELDAAGVLAVEVSPTIGASTAHLAWGGGGPATRTLQRSATSLILAAEPGVYRLRVAADDPGSALGSFRLRVAWTEYGTKGEGDSELELEPDPLVFGGPYDEGEGDTELELEPDPLDGLPRAAPASLAIVPGLTAGQRRALCRSSALDEESDDHADGFLCATVLRPGQRVAGTIEGDWGDDTDVFRFEVAEVEPIAVRVRAEPGSGFAAALYDATGQRLATLSAEEGKVRLVRALVAGTYFLRLEAPGTSPYTLRVGPPGRRR